MKRFPYIFYALFLLVTVSSCRSDKSDVIVYDVTPITKKQDDVEPTKNPKASKTYHTDSTYKYEYRTGETGSYQYHYDVIGENAQGEKVSGEVDMEGKYGVGIINNTIKVEAEWVDKGVIKAEDAKGNSYELIAK